MQLNNLKTITFNLKTEYFNQIRDGVKTEEYRELKPFWAKRLVDRHYDVIVVKLGYPPKNADDGKVLYFKWNGFKIKEITHEIFDGKTQDVYAIDLSERL